MPSTADKTHNVSHDVVNEHHVSAMRENGHAHLEIAAGNIASPVSADKPLLPFEHMEENLETAVLGEATKDRPSNKRSRTQTAFAFLSSIIPAGGMLSTVFNLASICVGAGILGLPAAANSTGLAMAFVYSAIIVVLTVHSLYCLAAKSECLQLKSYETMARALLGPGFDYFTAILRSFVTFGGCVAFIISVGDIFTPILNNTDAPEYWKSRSGNRLLTTLLWLTVMLPLVIPRHINSLRYVSMVGVAFIIYFVIMLIVHACMNGLPENVHNIHTTSNTKDEGIHLFGTGNTALNGLGVFMFAFICQVNSFEVYWDMAERGSRRFTIYSAIAMILCFFLYFLTAFFGYLDFGSQVDGSVLLMYNPVEQPAVMIAYIGVLVKLCASFPLLAMATRNALYNTVGWDADTLAFWKHCISAVTIAVAALLCGLFIPNVNMVFGFIGSFCGGTLAFIFPALFMMYGGGWSLRSVGWAHYILTYSLLIAGVGVVVFGTGATIYSAAVSI